MNTETREKLTVILDRYIKALCDFGLQELPGTGNSRQKETKLVHVLTMLRYMKENVFSMESGKLNRWLGYCQGILALSNVVNVMDERELTRDVFNPERVLPIIDLTE